MAAITDAMNWYKMDGGSGILTTPRLKYLFNVTIYSSILKSDDATLLLKSVKSVELPKFNIEHEMINSWNMRSPIPTRINFEPINIVFYDTVNNSFQKFISTYMSILSGSLTEVKTNVRYGLDNFGLKSLDNDAIIDKIEIVRFQGASDDRTEFSNVATTTLWRPKIVDVQHDTLDYSASEAVTWTVSFRYDSISYS